MPLPEEILEWMKERPPWQRDAIRRLVHGSLSDADLDALLDLCKAPHGLVDDPPPLVPVAREHFGGASDQDHSVELLEISDVQNVNAIRSDVPVRISPHGITLVYGPNGAGKSGYIRLLKQVCRARGDTPVVLPNVYASGAATPAAAKVRYQVDEVAHECDWEAGQPSPPALRLVSIFDHECAGIYTDARCAVAYLPAGLDLLPRLTDVCQELQRRLDAEIAALNARTLVPPVVPPNTTAEQVLSSLDEDGARDSVAAVATFSTADEARLRELDRHLNVDDPVLRAAEIEARGRRIRSFSERLAAELAAVGTDREEAVRRALADRTAARQALRLASEDAFEGEPVQGTGTQPWRLMWAAARHFSLEVARPDETYPPSAGEECLLCQQPLEATAADRMARFDSFVTSELEAEVRRAEHELEVRRTAVRTRVPVSADQAAPEVALADEDLSERLTHLVAAVQERRAALLAAESVADLSAAPALPDGVPLAALSAFVSNLQDQAEALRAMVDPNARAALQRERDELRGRQRLTERRDEVFTEIERRRRIRALEEARRTTVTTGVTRRNTELTERYLTNNLALRFSEMLRDLRLDYLPVRVGTAPGTRGVAYHQLGLEGVHVEATPGRVFSQGEHRCVALAAFLAEIQVQASSCTIVLDDPVSSLDHDRRRIVANRVVEIARHRPVLIFTHDLAFALALQRYADEEGVEVTPRRLLRGADATGSVREDLPWDGTRLRSRVGQLRDLHQQAAAAHRRGDHQDYERRAKEIYGYLREGWERGVEEVLLNGAVERFAPEVQTQRLRRLSAITDDHVNTLERGMSKTSRWLRGHDDAAALDEPVPPPDELAQDIEELEAWRVAVTRAHEGR